ncbi:MAG: twin-arginine translocase subunit TatC [Planctomycetota bacterium]
MPPTEDDEAVFEKSKMSFAEHLEELRSTLFKSLGSLLLGTLVGLLFGQQLVDFIQIPLREALESFYQDRAEEQVLERFQEMRQSGEPTPADIESAAKQYADSGYVPYEIFVDPAELQGVLGVDSSSGADSKAAGPDALVRLRAFRPLEEDPRLSVVGLSAHEPFMVYMKASVVLGAIVASPLIFYFLWDFVAAGLYKNERNSVYTFLPISLGLFFAGAALAFFVVFDFVLDFLFWFNARMGIAPFPRISDWLGFVLLLPLGFGVSFQLPLVMLFLERIGVFTVQAYIEKWRIAVLVIAVISMFLTPADPGSMLLMGVPLVVLYFAGIAFCRYMPGGASADPPAGPPAEAATGS